MTGDDRCGRAADALFRRSMGHVLVRLPGGPLHTLTGTAAEVWELLEREPTTSEVAGALAARYDAPSGDIVADVASLLETLTVAGLVVARPGRAPAPPLA